MRARDIFHETHASLSAKPGRSFLTVLGIVIGIMSVVVMVSVISGVSAWLSDSLGLGSARVVTITSTDSQHELVYDDAEFLTANSDVFESALPVAQTSATVGSAATSDDEESSTDTSSASDSDSSSSSSTTLQVVGADSSYFELEDMSLSSGSAYSDDALDEIVLDETAVETVFGSGVSGLGQTVTLDGEAYRVVGVVESSMLGSMMDVGMAYVPYRVASEVMIGSEQVDEILALAVEDADVDYAASRAVGMLAARHNVEFDEDGEQDAYSASTLASSIEALANFELAFDALAALVAGIALLVGGIGIMNMMLTNVSERYREIGLRKSLGARPHDITVQFLAESIALCLTGGVAGIVLGYAGAWGLIAVLGQVNSAFVGLTPAVTPQLVVGVFAVCSAIGVVFGIYPARRAAKLSPAETLRYQ